MVNLDPRFCFPILYIIMYVKKILLYETCALVLEVIILQ